VRLLADLHISPSTVSFLRSVGHDVVRVDEVLPNTTSDAEILARAAQESRAVLTQDLDFSALVAVAGMRAPSLISLRRSSSRVDRKPGAREGSAHARGRRDCRDGDHRREFTRTSPAASDLLSGLGRDSCGLVRTSHFEHRSARIRTAVRSLEENSRRASSGDMARASTVRPAITQPAYSSSRRRRGSRRSWNTPRVGASENPWARRWTTRCARSKRPRPEPFRNLRPPRRR
jgi:predicted nuclease of predicted toxin-antitoxin system